MQVKRDVQRQAYPMSGNGSDDTGCSFADPVFVVCNGRSGSTLLRFLLDAHPELACPPETNLPAMCAQLATVWSLIEGAPLSANRGDEPPVIPEAAIFGIRATMDRMVGSYLERRGKQRYCDKSLGTARFADLLLRVYPEARFLCLYRHPMDVIASGVEACPWGLNGYGFDSYIAATPGNEVLALAQFWADNTAETLAVEERLGERCLRVRYEDLVTDSEGIAAGIFRFVGVAPAPGISASCFSADRERFGPADHKIWYTSEISTGSVGRGWSVPVGLIPPPVLTAMNELTGKLGYLAVDGEWGTSAPPADLRVPLSDPAGAGADLPAGRGDRPAATAGGGAVASAAPDNPRPMRSESLAGVLRWGLAGVDQATAQHWGPHGAETFVAVWVPRDTRAAAEHWLVDIAARTVSFTGGSAQKDSDWDVVGSADAWEQVIAGTLNLSVALRACQLRYCDGDESRPLAADTRMAILGQLLGVAGW
jgi:protein-tyrosine sulfotransferase